MKKKNILILLAILLVTGCSNQKSKDTNSESSESTQVDKGESQSSGKNTIVNDNGLLSFAEEIYESDIIFEGTGEANIKIEYPKVEGLDKSITSKINEHIKVAALGNIENDEIYRQSDERIYINYQLYANESVLSIKFTGGLADGRTKLVSTLNFDLNTGEKIKLADMYNINQELVDYIFSSDYYNEDERIRQSHQHIVDNYSDSILMSLQNADTGEYYSNGTDDTLYIYTFLKEDTVEIIFYHGFNALGGHYPEELTYEELDMFKK